MPRARLIREVRYAMSFRRGRSDAPESSSWRLAHRRELLECGLPRDVVSSDRGWIYVLLHGDDELGTGWQADWITIEQARRLLALPERELATEVGYDLVRILRARCAQGA